ncbi:ParB/RepB/Spo0J family partition protein [Gemmatimonadota bacterium]
MTKVRKERLGRGLGALLGDYLAEPEPGEVRKLPVGKIRPNPFQPRRDFPAEELDELARSIRENGLLQPLVVRPTPLAEEDWELVAGERRLRAVSHLGWEEVPAMVRAVDDQTLLVLALVENLQREALGALEEAEGYRVLSESFGLTQGEIAQAVGKNRSTVANTLRLLQLPPSIRQLLESGKLDAGHARALLTLQDPLKAGRLARQAATEGWSVRRVEEAVRGDEGKKRQQEQPRARRDPLLKALEEELRSALGTRVMLRTKEEGKGVIEIPFLGSEDLERLFSHLTGKEIDEVLD